MSIEWVARLALVMFALYNIAFYAEGYRPRGRAAMKTLGGVSELLIWIVLGWAAV